MANKPIIPLINFDTTPTVTPRVRKTKGFGHWNSFLKSKEYTDLTPGTKQISEDELSKHNKAGDLWIGLSHEGRVCVYDVTLFAEYHPGGYEILESVAGKDATEDFRVAHAYVSPNMIARFQIGFLFRSRFNSPNSLSPGRSMLAPVRIPTLTNKPKWDWTESGEMVTVKFNLHKVLVQGLDAVAVQCSDSNVFKMRIFFETEYFYFEIQLNKGLKVLLHTLKHNRPDNNISIMMNNPSTISLSNLGGVLEDSMVSVLQAVDKEEYFRCSLVSTRDLNGDCREFTLQWPDWVRVGVPMGHHVIIKSEIQGVAVQRPYTPVCEMTPNPTMDCALNRVTLMIKRYSDGAMSSYMHTLDEDSTVFVSLPIGTFKSPAWINASLSLKTIPVKADIDSVVFIAAGSGITPIIRLMLSCLLSSPLHCHLAFFNRKQSDIIYLEEFVALEKFYAGRVTLSFVLSQSDQNWTGLKGRINEPLCKELFDPTNGRKLYLICGPTGFNKTATEIIGTWPVPADHVWEFKG